MTEREKGWLLAIVVVMLLVVGIFVWPTPYRYETVTYTSKSGSSRQDQFRTNRFTGETEMVFSSNPGINASIRRGSKR